MNRSLLWHQQWKETVSVGVGLVRAAPAGEQVGLSLEAPSPTLALLLCTGESTLAGALPHFNPLSRSISLSPAPRPLPVPTGVWLGVNS
jgi:hypothetical protein